MVRFLFIVAGISTVPLAEWNLVRGRLTEGTPRKILKRRHFGVHWHL